MFAEMMKEICKKRNSCFGCPCEYTCHVLTTSEAPNRWGEEGLRSANQKLDVAIASLLNGGKSHD